MKRLWIAISCSVGFGFSSSLYAMALGEIDLRSALNEPLNAAVEVFGADAVALEQVQFSLANVEAFTAAGLDRPYFLDQIHFAWDEDKQGHYFLHLTTQDPIREPSLDFLVEVDWPNGHLMREFAVLLDPPNFIEGGNSEAEAPVTLAAPEVQQPKHKAAKPKPKLHKNAPTNKEIDVALNDFVDELSFDDVTQAVAPENAMATVSQLQQALAQSKEALDTAKRTNEEMTGRMSKLEQDLISMRELVLQKNQVTNASQTPSTVKKFRLNKKADIIQKKPVENSYAYIWKLIAGLLGTVSLLGYAIHRGWLPGDWLNNDWLNSDWMRRNSDEDEFEEIDAEQDPKYAAPASVTQTEPTSKEADDDLKYVFKPAAAVAKPTIIGQDAEEEADILIAFGRFSDAEQILQTALKLKPEANNLRTKLLQVYSKSGDRSAFDEIYAQIPADYWQANPAKAERIQQLLQKVWPAKPVENSESESNAPQEPLKSESLFDAANLKQSHDGSIEYEPPQIRGL